MKTAFFDVDTQLDFVYPAGALYSPGAEEIAGPLRELTRFASANNIQIISTADAHAEDDPEFSEWKPHCVAGTAGQQKLACNTVKDPLILSSASGALQAIQPNVSYAAQIVIEKQRIDCFTNPNLKPLLSSLDVKRFIAYGLLTEFCLHFAIFGLLDMGFQVEVVTDAIKSLNAEKGGLILKRFQEAGGRLTTVRRVTANDPR